MSTDRYQKRAVSMQEVVDRIDIGDPERVSRLILSVSPCRSGTTVFLRVFGAVGIRSHFQELKNVLRWLLQGGEARWQVPQRPSETVYLKETLGPYTEAESSFDPLVVLLGAGFPPEKLHVLILGRAPLHTWASWEVWWKVQTGVDRFILTYRTTEQVRQRACRQGVSVTTLVYEAIRDNGAGPVIEKLFERLGVPYAPVAVTGWGELEPFGAPGSNIVFPEEPPVFVVPHIHDRAKQARRLLYISRDESVPGLHEDDVRRIVAAGVPGIYEGWRRACQEELAVQIRRDPLEESRFIDLSMDC